ncbi:MAG: hypothetical protein LBB80_03715 [Treponema sp.]|nr:hypothetical protein [Treponema sp.]
MQITIAITCPQCHSGTVIRNGKKTREYQITVVKTVNARLSVPMNIPMGEPFQGKHDKN